MHLIRSNKEHIVPNDDDDLLLIRRTSTLHAPNNRLEEWDESPEMKARLYYFDPNNISSDMYDKQEQLGQISDHLVVCNLHSSIDIFIKTLRSKLIGRCPIIVILTPNLPSLEMWTELRKYKKIMILEGSPLKKEDIIRTHIKTAIKAVILNSDLNDNTNNSDDLRDAETLFIYKIIQSVNPKLDIVCEIIKSSNVQYMQMNDAHQDYDSPEMYPLFCSGSVYFSNIIDTLTGQAYYNPFIVKIIQQILTGVCENNDSPSFRDNTSIWILNIPVDFVNKKFKDLFTDRVINSDIIPLGLYREPGATDNDYPYIYTNPDPDVRITMNDKLICISKNSNMQVQKESSININLPNSPKRCISTDSVTKLGGTGKKKREDNPVKFIINDVNSSTRVNREGSNSSGVSDE